MSRPPNQKGSVIALEGLSEKRPPPDRKDRKDGLVQPIRALAHAAEQAGITAARIEEKGRLIASELWRDGLD
jgi:hypothetical protein